MRNGKTLLVLLRTAIFTAIVPYAVGLWLPTQAHRAFSQAPFRVEPERWQIILSLLLLLAGAAIYLWCAWDFSVKGLGSPAPIEAPINLVLNPPLWFCAKPDVRRSIFADNFPRGAFLVASYCSLSGARCYLRPTVQRPL
jgi:hypothetical protein